ncbi:hypothetical protein CXG81DRAFT_13284 [Caulochytrium protostelioides]|uniref:non-specific serine/threonine protein kinase n=1 Tax=Caulochytrium protostelioides TaxID=1555241 RepID=A0A4P9X5J9_9FUNG|nr:kinase-like protein [Caulochytrium protostelioides]RKP00405.1 hypothetical protein CXG81DRAFT_13284 [Caulochytrium protostelioides]|eukprot:RKP00405.1 hypothetical protein CXG81DRAFT_13284 [Caulochytrium protostelioides]
MASVNLSRSNSETSLTEKYGKRSNMLGRGANATVRLCAPVNSDKKFAIKEFRKRRKEETQKEYVKKLIAEFCISSTLENENVIRTIDLIQDEKRQWCVVMEYCNGGDLYAKIHTGVLTDPVEINCYFRQLIQGVRYLHSMGVAHRDLKPENLLLSNDQHILKITDFGVSEVFRTPFCAAPQKAKGLCGSGPYIAPEEFERREYDGEQVDVWSSGIIYYVMMHNAIPWKAANVNDGRFKHFTEHRYHFWPIDKLPPGPRTMLWKMLEINPAKRITIDAMFKDAWFSDIAVCSAADKKRPVFPHTHKITCSTQPP